MKLTKIKLKQLIKEEISRLQTEGILDLFKGGEESKEDRLYRLTKEDFINYLGRENEDLLYNVSKNESLVIAAEQDIEELVNKMMADERGGGPRDMFELAVKKLAQKYKDQLESAPTSVYGHKDPEYGYPLSAAQKVQRMRNTLK